MAPGRKGDQKGDTPPPSINTAPQFLHGAGKGKRAMGTSMPLLREQVQKEELMGHDMGIVDLSLSHGFREPVPTSDMHTVAAGNRQIRLPLDVGTEMICKRRWDGAQHLAKIIERRKQEHTEEYEYYVHYKNLNRRMDEWVPLESVDLTTVETMEPEPSLSNDAAARTTRGQKRKLDDVHEDDDEHAGFDAAQLREHEEFTKVKNVAKIELGRYEMETWYFSPLPDEFKGCTTLYFAEQDLMFFKHREEMLQHIKKCKIQHPPGDEIYRNGCISMFEIDGKREKIYCQNLCYLAKLFLDHKTLYYDVDLFLFYVLCECDERGAHVVGYFSKEKHSEEGYNLACILTLPPYQRKGYGKFLISFSYELSKIEGKVGTPERPLSDLGLVSYRGYWTRELLKVLRSHTTTISIKELSETTGIKVDDVLSTLQHLNLIQYQKGQHVICAAPALLDKHMKEAGSAGLQVDPTKIVWTPYNAERELKEYRG